jgi:hypothetical protein
MKTNAAIDSNAIKDVPLDDDVNELLNYDVDFALVGLGSKKLDTHYIEKVHLE